MNLKQGDQVVFKLPTMPLYIGSSVEGGSTGFFIVIEHGEKAIFIEDLSGAFCMVIWRDTLYLRWEKGSFEQAWGKADQNG